MADVSDFKTIYIKRVDKYLKSRKDDEFVVVEKEIKEEKGKKGKKDKKTKPKTYTTVYPKLKVRLPTIEGFALYIKTSRQNVYNWEKNFPDFKKALDKIRIEQKERLINMGLSGDYNSTIAKLILSSDHGMVEKIDATSGGEPLNTFDDKTIDRIADRITARKGSNGGTSGKE